MHPTLKSFSTTVLVLKVCVPLSIVFFKCIKNVSACLDVSLMSNLVVTCLHPYINLTSKSNSRILFSGFFPDVPVVSFESSNTVMFA